MVIPAAFPNGCATGDAVGVQAMVDATDDNTANLVIGYAQAVVARLLGRECATRFSAAAGAQLGAHAALSVEARTWFNEDLESRNFIVPGVVAMVMAVIGTFLTSLTIAREWERGTMEQLISTPVTAAGGHRRQAGSLFRDRDGRRGLLRGDRGVVVRGAVSRSLVVLLEPRRCFCRRCC